MKLLQFLILLVIVPFEWALIASKNSIPEQAKANIALVSAIDDFKDFYDVEETEYNEDDFSPISMIL